jgi:hypothetical protein
MRSEDLRNKEGHARPEDDTRGGSAARVGAASFGSQGSGRQQRKERHAGKQTNERERGEKQITFRESIERA